MIFTGLYSLAHTLVVGLLAYASLVALLRVSGKRTLSKWNAFDLIVTVAFGSTLASALLSNDVPAAQAVLAFALLVALQFAVTWTSVRVPWVERMVKSAPTLLVHRGEIRHEALRRERVTELEIRAALRAHGIAELGEVGALVLETDGSFSIIKTIPPGGAFSLRGVAGAEPPDE